MAASIGKGVRGFFVTGTDTGVGKTVVAAAITVVLRNAGVNAAPMKPVQTGARRVGGELRSEDLDFCLKASELELDYEEYKLLCPVRLPLAASPHLAAAKAGVHLSASEIAGAVLRAARRWPYLVVEGAGGVLVPLNNEETFLELTVRLDLPVVVVTRPGLGTINHTLLTVRELVRAGLRIAGVVFCHSTPEPPGLIEKDNVRTIERLTGVRVLGRLPYLGDLSRLDPRRFALRAADSLIPAGGLKRIAQRR